MIKAILFDMDGVIINSEHLHFKAESSVLNEAGSKKITHEDIEKYTGMTFKDIAAGILKKDKDDPIIEKLIKKKFDILIPMCEKELKTFPEIPEKIKEFSKEFSLALASSSVIFFIEFVLNKFNLKKYFKVIISGADDEIKNGKPAPDIFLKAAEKLNVKPEECVVIEDAINGVKAAKAAGMKCIAVTNSFSMETLKKAKADLIVKTLKEVTVDKIKKLGDQNAKKTLRH